MYENSVKRNILDSFLLSEGSTENGVIGTVQYAVNQQEMVAFCLMSSELKAILECFD